MSKLETGLHYPLKLDVLPEAWRIGHVGDFADEIQPGFASGKHNKEGAGIPHIRPYNIDRQGKLDLTEIKSVAPESDAKRLRTGDVLFNNTNSPELIGKTTVIVSAEDWGFSNHMTRIRFKDDVAPKFAAYQLHFLWMTGYYLHNCVKHVNQASISSKTLANAVPFIAPPFDQQKRIVAEIEKQFSRLDEAVANLKRVKANLKRYKAAVLKAAVEGRLVETEAEIARREGRSFEAGAQLLQRILETRRSQWQGKGRYKEPAAPDTTDLPELPEGWVWATLDQIGQEGRPIIYGIIKPGPHDPNGVPYVRVTEMKDGFVDLENLRRAVPERAAKFARATLAPGDVLISKDGTIGRVAVVPPQLAGGNITQHVMRAPIHELMCRDYVVSAIRSDVCQKWLTGETKGVALRGVNVEDFRRLPIPVPPYIEQERVLAEVDRRLSLLSETEAQVDANLQRADRLREAILQRAFSSSSSHRTSIHTKLMGDDERLGT